MIKGRSIKVPAAPKTPCQCKGKPPESILSGTTTTTPLDFLTLKLTMSQFNDSTHLSRSLLYII
jgi:hypothetical protein